MPFDRNKFWTPPSEEDKAAFIKQLMSKPQEIAPTPEMVEAITTNLKKDISPKSLRQDIFNTIGKLRGPVDIVIPVYDGLHVLKPCIASIVKHTLWDYHLILVDDCSPDPAIKEYLDNLGNYCPEIKSCTILSNKKNRGFAATVNRGVAKGKNPYVCILNSDTLVTKGWLIRQLMALEADSKNVITNPATNNTALINVPMYNGHSYIDMADALAVAPNTLTYNEIMPTGFCLTVKRKIWNEVGPFDESFKSYGEDSKLWFDAIKQTDENGVVLRNRAVITDNSYIFHERSTSFSQLGNEEHMGLRQASSKRFHDLYPDFQSWRQGFDENAAVNHLRNEIPKAAFKKQYKGNIAWIVKSAAPCGGMNFVADIVNQLIEEGYNAKVCVVPDKYDEENPPNLKVIGNLRTAPILFKTSEEFSSTFTSRVFTSGKVFAAVTELTPLVLNLNQTYKGIEGYNHVQSYDVALAKSIGREDLVDFLSDSYKKLPNIVSSNWVAEILRKDGCEVQKVILPGVNPDLFHPRNRELGGERFTIAVLINEEYSFKGAKWAVEFIKALSPESYPDIRVLVIGPSSIRGIRGVTYLGSLPQAKMANLLGTEVDLFVDPSEIHSYGLPALEALCSGCIVLTRENKGIHEYVSEFRDRIDIENDPKEAAKLCLGRKDALVSRTVEFSPSIDRATNVRKFIDFIYPRVSETKHRIEVITPHLRKHGGPTTIISTALQLKALGHNVGISTIYTDWNSEVLRMAKHIKVRTAWNDMPEDIELITINSDNPFAKTIMEKVPDRKYIMLKLSHNPRFKVLENDNLNLPWDHIMTSTEWLRTACISPMRDDNWTHQAWPAHKVTTIGWHHYGHELFNMPPTNRIYGNANIGFRLGTLIHHHSLKGTGEALSVIHALKRKYESNFHAVGFGETKAKLPPHMQYVKNASRKDIAHVFKQLDVWFSASHSEGLGRMLLEAMSAGIAVVTTNTGAEFLKHGENCLLYDIGNPQMGAELVDRLVNDQDLFTHLVVNGYNTAAAAADPTNMRKNLSTVIEEVLNK